MDIKVRALTGWWMMILLSAAGLAAPIGDLRLVDAVEQRDQEAVRALLTQHSDVNTPQGDGATALAWAAHWDDLETAELLIRAGANVNAANDYGVTPLSLACSNGSAAMVEKLLKAGANPKAVSETGETALMTCARTGNLDAVKSLLARGADVNASENRRGQTALMWAVAEKHPKLVRELVEHGANVNARSRLSFTPPAAMTYGGDVHPTSTGGFTPLLFAAQQGEVESARILLAAGAKINDATQEEGTALVVAAASGQEALATFLLEKGADPNAADGNGMSALHHALVGAASILAGIEPQRVKFFDPDMLRPNMPGLVKALLAHGANPNVRMAQATPRLRLLFRARVSLDGATPFLLAAATGDLNIMRMLVAGGADPLVATKDGMTPLMAAAGVGRIEDRTEEEERNALQAVILTMELGGDASAAIKSGPRVGYTAVHGAAFMGSNPIIQLLVDHGAKLDVQDRCGQTPLTIAGGDSARLVDRFDKSSVHKSTVDLLRKLGAGTTPLPPRAADCVDEGGINSRYRKEKVTIDGAGYRSGSDAGQPDTKVSP